MRLIDEVVEIRSVADRWRAQYFKGGKWNTTMSGGSEAIFRALAALPSTATRDDVTAIIGNDSWIGENCSECGKPAVVMVGQEPDYESHTAWLCALCVHRLVEMLAIAQSEKTE